MRVSEAEVEDYLVAEVARHGGITAKMTITGRRGWPDRLVVLPYGRMVLVEVKRPRGGVLSGAQRILHIKLQELGATIWRVRCRRDVDQMIDELTQPILGAMPSLLWVPTAKDDDYD